MLLRTIRPALVLLALVPGLAQSQTSLTPPPPGPYQPVPDMASMPGQLQVPQAPQAGQAQPAATQVWGQPPVMQLPYWMQVPVGTQPGGFAPGAQAMNNRQGGTSPAASPDTRGGGQADETQLSPAGQTAAPPNFAGAGFQPGYGAGVTPGSFPGYTVPPGQAGAGFQDQNTGQNAGRNAGRNTGQSTGQSGAYGYPAYSGYPQPYQPYQPYRAYPGYPAVAPYPGQMPVPYWGAPTPYGYGTGAQPQANR